MREANAALDSSQPETGMNQQRVQQRGVRTGRGVRYEAPRSAERVAARFARFVN